MSKRKQSGVRIVGGTVVPLPTRALGTSEPGTFDERTGTLIRRQRPTTDDQRLGLRPTNRRQQGIGAGGPGEPL